MNGAPIRNTYTDKIAPIINFWFYGAVNLVLLQQPRKLKYTLLTKNLTIKD